MTFFRYVVIQVFAYVVDMGGFYFIIQLGLVGPIMANVIGKVAAGIFAFIVHRNFTFKAGGNEDRFHQALRYFTLLALNIPFASGLLAVLLMWVSDPVVAKIIVDISSVGLIYWLSKSFIFSKGRKGNNLHVDERST
jgi:putative flippase GtrA